MMWLMTATTRFVVIGVLQAFIDSACRRNLATSDQMQAHKALKKTTTSMKSTTTTTPRTTSTMGKEMITTILEAVVEEMMEVEVC